jgi:hypothetical protein
MIEKLKNTGFIVSLILAMGMLLSATGDTYTLARTLKTKGEYIKSDELGNVFLVKNNQVTKFNSKGEELHTYSNLYAGDISFVDTRDAFKIMLYYEAFGQVEFLDHTLSLTSSTIELTQLGLELATLVCSSYQGSFWVYNPVNFELIRINQQLEVSEQTGNLQQATGYSLNPNYMIERDNFLYVNDPAIGILIFDKYGSYFKTIPVLGLISFQVFNKKIIWVDKEEISIYDTKLNELSSTGLPSTNAISVSVCMSLDPQMLFLLEEEKLVFYQIH